MGELAYILNNTTASLEGNDSTLQQNYTAEDVVLHYQLIWQVVSHNFIVAFLAIKKKKTAEM